MKYTLVLLFLMLLNTPSICQTNERMFGGREINIRVLFLNPYYEFGEDKINHIGFSGGISIYKRFFIGGYKQWGKWESFDESNNFESKFNHGGFLLGNILPIKNSKFLITTSCYLGIGKSTSKQSIPIVFSNAEENFKVVTPEFGIEYRIIPLGSLMLSTGNHFYSRRNPNDLPLGFNGFELNRFYAKLSLRIGV